MGHANVELKKLPVIGVKVKIHFNWSRGKETNKISAKTKWHSMIVATSNW